MQQHISKTSMVVLALQGHLKKHFLIKSIFGYLLSILRYLTILSQSNLSYRWKSEACCLLPCLSRRLRCANTRDFGSRTGDSGPRLRATFLRGVTRPSNGGGDFFLLPRILWPESFQARRLQSPRPETPPPDHLAQRLRSLDTGDSGPKRQQRLVLPQGL
jgi:hypothetical protein